MRECRRPVRLAVVRIPDAVWYRHDRWCIPVCSRNNRNYGTCYKYGFFRHRDWLRWTDHRWKGYVAGTFPVSGCRPQPESAGRLWSPDETDCAVWQYSWFWPFWGSFPVGFHNPRYRWNNRSSGVCFVLRVRGFSDWRYWWRPEYLQTYRITILRSVTSCPLKRCISTVRWGMEYGRTNFRTERCSGRKPVPHPLLPSPFHTLPLRYVARRRWSPFAPESIPLSVSAQTNLFVWVNRLQLCKHRPER